MNKIKRKKEKKHTYFNETVITYLTTKQKLQIYLANILILQINSFCKQINIYY